MGGLRRRLRRQAKDAAKQLLKQGVPLNAIGRITADARTMGFLGKVIDAAEKRIETGEGKVTVREGIAAAQTITKLQAQQAKALDHAAEQEEEQLLEEEIAENKEQAATRAEKHTQSGTGAPSASDGLNANPQATINTHAKEESELRATG
jgi:uncharacterized membrane protein YdbT with pleckstrin-like domain